MSSPRVTSFRRDGLVFDVVDSGPLDGTPVVLLHGFPQRATSWSGVTAQLNARGYRTYAPDQRGYSPGARPRSRFAYGGAQLRDDVVALIDEIGQPVHLVGHDWGSAVGWSVAGHHPDRVLSYTAVSVPHPAAFLRSWLGVQLLKSYYMFMFQLPLLPEWLMSRRSSFSDQMMRRFGMSAEMVQTYRREIVDAGALRGGLGYYRSMLVGGTKGLGAKVSVPTTLVWSDDDAALGRKGVDLTPRWVTGPYELEVYEGVSHWIPDEAPERLAASIERRIAA